MGTNKKRPKRLINILSLIVITFSSCSSSKKLKENRELLKEYAFSVCLYYATQDSGCFKNDMSAGVYVEIASYSRDVFIRLDSLAKKAASAIKPLEVADYDNKKAVISECFTFYHSKELDSLIRTMDKNFDRSFNW